MRRAMAEFGEGLLEAPSAQHRLMSDAAKGENGTEIWQSGHLGGKELVAGGDFGGQRLVFRRHAAHCVSEVAAVQGQTIIGFLLVAA